MPDFDLPPSSTSTSLDDYLSSQRPLLLSSESNPKTDNSSIPAIDNDEEVNSWTTEEEDLATSSGVSAISINRSQQNVKLKRCSGEFVVLQRKPTDSNSDLAQSLGRSRLLISVLLVIIAFLLLTIIGFAIAIVVIASRTKIDDEFEDVNWRTATFSTSSSLPPNNTNPYHMTVSNDLNMQAIISAKLISSFLPMQIRDNLRWISEKMHVAGTRENTNLMHKLADQYRAYGYDVKMHKYNVLLSYPDYDNPNTIETNIANDWLPLSDGLAEQLGPKEALDQETDPRMLVWWNAYAGNGTVIGPIVYVNYGTLDDYRFLDKKGIDLNGKIILCRYGAVWRGSKVSEAQSRGAIGVILYNDPADYTAFDGKTNQTFPDQIWMPSSGAQRGTLSDTDGDPETPLLPSKDYTYRSENADSLKQKGLIPRIPVTPIGYRDAIKIMARLDGPEVGITTWQGGMNVPYRLTGSALFRLTVRATLERRPIVNVIATMWGSDEPDRHVLIGNHVDAWVKGALDPNSGTATMLEMARVLASVSNSTGWRPRRTIRFCQWDAEEFGTIGSTEFIEEFLKPLQSRAIAYLNVDNINGNTTIAIKAVPLLYRVIVDAAQRIPNPNADELAAGRMTVLDSWRYYNGKGPITGDAAIPQIALPDFGSDFESFIGYVGVPVLDIKYVSAPKYSYMLYHTMYEIPWTVENLVDTGFTCFTAVGQMLLEMGRNLADSLIIPFNVRHYAITLMDFVNKLEAQLLHSGIITALGNGNFTIAFKNLRNAVDRFQEVANEPNSMVNLVNTGGRNVTVRQAEILNTRLLTLERAFVAEYGIYPERASKRHTVFTNSQYDVYTGVTFAVILDPAVEWRNAIDDDDAEAAEYWLETVRIGFTKVQYAIESAILVLELDDFDEKVENR